LSIGARAAVRGGMLRVDDGLFVDLRPAYPYHSHLHRAALSLVREPVRSAWNAAWSALRNHGTFAPLMSRGGAAIAQMCKATRDLDCACARQAMSALIGLGEGLTPSGDDYLVGYFLGLLSCAAADGARQGFIAEFGESLRAMASRTNQVSRMYLEAAVEGEVSERLATLVYRIAAGASEQAVALAAAAALAVGHNSGSCGVLGLLLGSAAWEPGLTRVIPDSFTSGYEGPDRGSVAYADGDQSYSQRLPGFRGANATVVATEQTDWRPSGVGHHGNREQSGAATRGRSSAG